MPDAASASTARPGNTSPAATGPVTLTDVQLDTITADTGGKGKTGDIDDRNST